jgi:hypothetical protein
MRKFSDSLNVNNKNNFNLLWEKRVEEILRESIYDFIISRKSEDEYFDLDKYSFYGRNLVLNSVKKCMSELENLEWKVKLSFADTGLFIYSTEEVPKTCW